MTTKQRREDILERYHAVIAERTALLKDTVQYQELTKIAGLILNELLKGNETRHIMFLVGTHYDYRCERIFGSRS